MLIIGQKMKVKKLKEMHDRSNLRKPFVFWILKFLDGVKSSNKIYSLISMVKRCITIQVNPLRPN